MKKINSTYIDNLVSKIINETLEGRANSLVSKINELGGMDDDHRKSDKPNLSKMTDKEIENLLKKPVRGGMSSDDEEKWNELDEESEVCECGGGLYEGECMECGKSYMDEDIYDVSKNFPKKQSFDYVQEEDDVDFEEEESEKEEENSEFCRYQKKMFGSEDERYQEKCLGMEMNMNERLRGNQKRIDKNKNNKIDVEDFRMLRKDETKEGKKFPDLSGDGKVTRKDVLMGRGVKLKKSLKLSESEMIDLIEKIVLEDKVKSNIKNLTEPKGLTTYKRAV